MSVIKDITKVSAANFISLFSAILTGFIVPAFLSIEQYAYLKTFGLILSFVGFLHFGYIDGIYIKYGGKYSHDLDMRMFKTEKKFFIIFQLLMSVLILIAGIVFNELIIIMVASVTLPFNLLSYYQFYYQAIGQFNIYSKIRLIVPFGILLFNVILIYLIKVPNYLYYVSAEILVYLIVVVYLELKYSFKIKSLRLRSNFLFITDNFKIGFYIMLGNIGMILFFTLGRWAVKIFMSDADFAYFSFAASMMQVLTIVISSIAMTFYPYLSRLQKDSNLARLKIQLIIIGAFFSVSYFIFNIIVTQFIPKYLISLKIIGILFASFPAYAVINALYINMYKVQKDGKKYIIVILINLFSAFIFATVALLISKSLISIAMATTLSFYFWMYFSCKDFKGLNPKPKEILYIIIYLFIYIISVLYIHAYWDILFFCSLMALLSTIYKEELNELFNKLHELIIINKNK